MSADMKEKGVKLWEWEKGSCACKRMGNISKALRKGREGYDRGYSANIEKEVAL